MSRSRYKRSRQREYLLKLLQGTDKHPAADWLYNKLKLEFTNLSMGTVYRNLNILLNQNLIQKIDAGSNFDRYDGNIEEHYHFICRKCESIYDLDLEVLEGLNTDVSRATGFNIENHRLFFYGVCPACSEIKQYQV